jgi:16S rRNA (cytosine967-C5)-methyltransferase
VRALIVADISDSFCCDFCPFALLELLELLDMAHTALPPTHEHAHHPLPPLPSLPSESLGFALAYAACCVAEVLEGKSLGDFSHVPATISASQKGAIRDLSLRTLRSHGRGKAFLAPFVQKPLPPIIEGLLLVALCRLDERPKDAYRIVDQAVQAASALIAPLKGVVNAILRTALRQRESLLADIAKNPEALWQHPAWWVRRVRTAFPTQWKGILTAGNSLPPMSLRPNQRQTSVEALHARLQAEGIECTQHPPCALRLKQAMPAQAVPGFAQGLCSIQDIGAQWASHFLAPCAGDRVLDACAAPGNKAAHLLESAPIVLHAIEQDPVRMARLENNLHRLALSGHIPHVADCRQREQWWDGEPFDAILADVPCTGSGVARRHPDMKWLRREKDIHTMAHTQSEILDALWPTLKPGGRLLYATCSVFPEENEEQITAFLARTPSARRVLLQDRPFFQLLPCEDHDGFFYALLMRQDHTQ